MFTMLPTEIISRLDLSCQARLYFCWLCEKSNRSGQSWWGVQRSAEALGVSQRSIQRWRRALQAKGLIGVQAFGKLQIVTVTDYPAPRSDDTRLRDSDRPIPTGAAMGDTPCHPSSHRPGALSNTPASRVTGGGVEVHAPACQPGISMGDTPCHPSANAPSTPGLSCHPMGDRAVTLTRSSEQEIYCSATTLDRSNSVSRPDPVAVEAINERLIRIARTEGLDSFGGRILDLRAEKNRDRVLAVGSMSDEAIGYGFRVIETLRGTVLYPICTWYLLDQLLLHGSTWRPRTQPQQTDPENQQTDPENQHTRPDAPAPWGAFLDWARGNLVWSTVHRWLEPLDVRLDPGGGLILRAQDAFDSEFVRRELAAVITVGLGHQAWRVEG